MNSLYITWLHCWALRLLFLTSITCPAHLFASSFIQGLLQLSFSLLSHFSLARLSILTRRGEVRAGSGRTERKLERSDDWAWTPVGWHMCTRLETRYTFLFTSAARRACQILLVVFSPLPLGMQTCPHLCTLIKNNKATFPDSPVWLNLWLLCVHDVRFFCVYMRAFERLSRHCCCAERGRERRADSSLRKWMR